TNGINKLGGHEMNEMIKGILSHASVRQFTEADVPDTLIEELARVGQQAPFTGQMYSCIYTKDPAVRERLCGYFGSLPRKGPVFMLFCLDFRKLEKFIASKDRNNAASDTMMLFLGIQDVAYFAQNLVLAAESVGLGAVMLGSAPNYSSELSIIFELPDRVFPVVGLVLGWPAESPKPRPRIPTKFILNKDIYHDLSDDEVQEALDIMDAGLIREGYYARSNSKINIPEGEKDDVSYDTYGWGEHISRKYAARQNTSKLKEELKCKGIHI
ncbi:MAG: nitroreductase family protein, partial [bacterium]|nr:nitroreductase family protein [bacterium]